MDCLRSTDNHVACTLIIWHLQEIVLHWGTFVLFTLFPFNWLTNSWKLQLIADQVIPQEVVHTLYSTCKSGNFELAEKEVNNVIAEGYPVSQMISQVFFVFADNAV